MNSIASGRLPLLALITAGVFLVTTPHLYSQALYGSLTGDVTDATGAVVPGATVKLAEAQTGQVRQTTTNNSGIYSFPTLTPGSWTITVTHSGFETFIQSGVPVAVGEAARVDVSMRVGATSQAIEVSGQTAELQTENAEVRAQISSKQLQYVPVPINRNYQNLLVMVPGVSPPNTSSSLTANPARGEVFSVNGTTQGSTNTRIEGANAINGWMSHETGYVPGLDAIETVSVSTNSMDADQGLAGGASVNVQLKSGTNDLHGSAFEFNQNNGMKANPFFLPAGQQAPKFINNQLGGTVGGPIIKNKLFYFVSYDGQFIRQNAQTFATVPTAAIRAGDMSGSSTPIYNPFTGAADGSGRIPFVGNQIPQNLLDPIALKLQQTLLPLPNLSGVANNYFATGDYSVNRHKVDAKVNYNVSSKFNLSARLGALDYSGFNPALFGDNGGPVSSAGGRPGNLVGTVFNGTLSGTYTVTPNFIVDSYFGYTRLDTSAEDANIGKGNLGLTLFNIPGTNGPTHNYGGYPTFEVSNYSNFGKYPDAPVYYTDPAFDYVANADWIKGKHNIRFGVDIERIANTNWELGTAGGVFTFTGGPTALNASGAPSTNQYNSYATFLLGLTSTGTNNFVQDNARQTSRMWANSLYVRDQWQVTRKLTASLGMRWDYLPFGTGANRGFETFNFQTNTMYLCGVGSTPRDCGVTVPKLDFSPRIGIAYRITPTFVVRTGFAINYDPNPLAWVRDFVGEAELTQSATTPATLNSYQYSSPLSTGIPAVVFPSISNGVITNYPLTQSFTVPQSHYKMGYIESWNFTVEKQLPGRLIATAGYVGDRQIKQLQVINVNYGLPGGGTASEPLYQAYGRSGSSGVVENFGRNSYDSLQTKLERSFANGFLVNASYTFSKAMALCCDQLSDKGPAIPIPQYINLDKALWGSNRTHVFAGSFVYQLPFGPGKKLVNSGVGGAILGGWQIQGLTAIYSGLPFSVSAPGTSLNAPGSTQRANQIKPNVAILGNVGPGQSWFDPLAFAPVTNATFGTAGYNSIVGPGAFNLDAGITRDFRIRERFTLQIRADAFNATNTPHFANPSGDISGLVLNSNGSIKTLGGYSSITATSGGLGREGIDERCLQLGARISF